MIKVYGRVVWPSKVECMTTTMSYLHEQLTLIFAHEMQAGNMLTVHYLKTRCL